MLKRQSGFSLAEVAIVLVIIGLLLGGVLKGQELIENAKIKSLRNDFNGISIAFYAYQDRYRSMPGDDGLANNKHRGWLDSSKGNSNGVLKKNDAFDAGASENQYLWQHLRYAGLIQGNPAGKTDNQGGRSNPIHSFNGKFGVTYTSKDWGIGLSGHIICAGSVPGKAAQAVDAAFDDGVPNTGKTRAMVGADNAEPKGRQGAERYVNDGATFYTICRKL